MAEDRAASLPVVQKTTESGGESAGVGLSTPSSSVKLSTRVKGPPSIEVTVHHEDVWMAEELAIKIFEGLRDRYGSFPEEKEES
jgi:hypothetical protein